MLRSITAVGCAFLTLFAGTAAVAAPDPYPQQSIGSAATPQSGGIQNTSQQLLTEDQLSNLVAPIALYPDPLLGQILAASTYPLEIVEAQQWLSQNPSLRGQQLVEAAKQQDWDPSVQLLVAFPDAIALLNRDIRWTTDLGNAFLAQQPDVMNAIQSLRLRARDNGRLTNTPQQVIGTDSQNGQQAITIEPANPQVIYPPVYNPQYVWGPPASGYYPPVSWAPAYSAGYDAGYGGAYGGGYGVASYGAAGYGGYGFGSGINIAGLFSNLISWNGWGWVLGWFTHSLSLAGLFFDLLGGFGGGGGHYGVGGGWYGAGYHGGAALALWEHNPAHRLGVAYPRGFVASAHFNPEHFNNAQHFNNAGRLDNAERLNSARVNSGVQNGEHFNSPRPGQTSEFRSSAMSAPRAGIPTREEANTRGVGAAGTDWHRFGTPAEASRFESGRMSEPARIATARTYTPQTQSSFPRQSFTGQSFQESRPNAYSGSYQGMQSSRMPEQRYAQQQSSAQRSYSEPRYSEPKYSAPKYSSQKYSAPHYSEPKFSAPKFSAPKAPKMSAPKSSGGGHSSGKSSHKH
jgi:hypothetical protein